VPEDIFNRDVLGPKFKETKLQIGPSTLQDIKLEGTHLQWENWDFRFSFNQREGLVLHQIAFNDQGKLRSICYRASISEMLVPYSDPSQGWIWREFLDSGEYGLGYVSTEANAGKDLPENAVTLDAVLPTESLEPSSDYPNRVFFYEQDGGGLFAHTQPEDGSHIYARAKELVAGFVSTVGNYDYLFKWVFRQDGTFAFEAELHGLILNKTIKDETCQACAVQAADGPGTYVAKGDQRFGTIVSPQIEGVYHQHWINLRMDFDIDGTVNAVEECNTKLLPYDPETNPRGRAFTVQRTVFGKEKEAERKLNPSTNRTWRVYNPNAKSAVGHYSGYEIEPVGNTTSAIPEFRFGDESSFTQRHLWVTKYHPEQLYAAGKYPNQAPAGYQDYLFEYAKNNEKVYQEDVVLWYSLGFTHLTRPEDYPIMPAGKVAVNFAPAGFFEKSPALGYAHIEKGE
jgi:primary-amine oxidase